MIIVTNNPKVRDTFIDKETIWVNGSFRDVLIQVRDMVHQSHTLLTHPLSGSVKPNETPYKTIAIEPGIRLDIDSLLMIENAIDVYDRLQADRETPSWPLGVLADFMVIDCDLINCAVIKRA